MKYKMNRIIALAFWGLIGVLVSSCQEDEIRTLDTEPGNFLDISGDTLAYVGDELSYSLFMNRTDVDYNWAIGEGATITENAENDAYVSVLFNEFGVYQLDVNAGDASGSMEIEAVSHEVSFQDNSVTYIESLSAIDTLEISLEISGGFNSSVDGALVYAIGGTVDSDRYSVLEGFESPIVLDSSRIKIAIYSDEEVNAGETLELSIVNVNTDLSDAYVVADTLQTIVYTFEDDVKEVSLDSVTVELDEVGVYTIPVSLSNASNSSIAVAYTVSSSIGVTDISQEVVRGVLSFPAGATSKDIALDVSESAFTAEQEFTITLQTVTSNDGEVAIDDALDTKTFVTVSEE